MTFTTNYSTEVTSSSNSGLRYLEAGIHENCKITNIKVDKTANGVNFIEFTIENEGGQILRHTKFEPTPMAGEDALATARRGENFMRNILQIVRCYTAENFEAGDFISMAKWIKGVIEPKMDTTLLRVKAIYRWSEANNRDFTALPSYFDATYVEPMSITKANSAIRILSNDKIEKTYPADKETQVQDPAVRFGAPAQPTTVKIDDIPF